MDKVIKQTVRKLRKSQTEGEKLFWEAVRNRKIAGKKFLRQFPISFKWRGRERFFVADFYCHEARLVIEIDGGIHEKQKDYDKVRDSMIKRLDIGVVRLDNELIKTDLKSAIKIIEMHLNSPLLKREGKGMNQNGSYQG